MFKMCRFKLGFYISLLLNMALVHGVQDWEYVLQRFEKNNSNQEMIDFEMRPIRVSQGNYAVNGSVFLGVDIDDTYLISLRIFHSPSGSSQYRETPYGIRETKFSKFMNTIYVKMLQKDMVDCSDLPHYETEFIAPLKKGRYYVRKCLISNERMPNHLNPGLYKAAGHLKGEILELSVSVIFDVSAKSLY